MGSILNVTLQVIFPQKVGDFQDIALFRPIAAGEVPKSPSVAQ